MNRIARIRKDVLGMSQADLADAVGVAQATVSRWEHDELSPSLDQLVVIRKLARARDKKWSDSRFFEGAA